MKPETLSKLEELLQHAQPKVQPRAQGPSINVKGDGNFVVGGNVRIASLSDIANLIRINDKEGTSK